MAVLIVSGFGAIVDWRKEKEFVKRSQADEDAKFVGALFILLTFALLRYYFCLPK